MYRTISSCLGFRASCSEFPAAAADGVIYRTISTWHGRMATIYSTDVYSIGDNSMVRTQIYLTESQREELAAIAKAVGKKQSELIREAIDWLIDQAGSNRRKVILREAAGIWKDRTDLPDFKATRIEWDRN